jgi:hypothetical protein
MKPEIDQLVFLHIPKTGGTTLGVPLRLIYGYSRSMQVGNDDTPAYRNLPLEERRHIRLLKGHVTFGIHKHCPGTTRYITLVREPVAQVDSFYRMLLDEYSPSQFSRKSLETYINGHPTYVHNRQLRMVTGVGPEASVGMDTLKRAKDLLNECFVVVGTTERFGASLLLMKERLDWSWPPFYVRSRTGDKETKKPIPGRVRRIIREQNKWDIRLYQYVSNQLESEIERRGASFQRYVRRFRMLNGAFAAVARRPLQLFRILREWGKARGGLTSLR